MVKTQLNQHRLLDQQKFSINLRTAAVIHHPHLFPFTKRNGNWFLLFMPSITAKCKNFGQMPMTAEIEGWLNRGYQLIVMTENDERATQVQVV